MGWILAGVAILSGAIWVGTVLWTTAKAILEWRTEVDAEEEERAMYRSCS